MTGNHVYGQLYRGFESLPLRKANSRFLFLFVAALGHGATRLL